MGMFISADRIGEAVTSLGLSSVQARLGDYLIFKRALALAPAAGEGTVVTGTTSSQYVEAVRQWASIVPPGTEPEPGASPYFVPFGSARDTTRGYRTAKFPSNGPSDTVSRWQSQENPPFRTIEGTKPRAYRFETPSAASLAKFFLIAGSGPASNRAVLPRISDAAVWWFRFSDLTDQLVSDPSAGDQVEIGYAQLGSAFITNANLSTTEIEVLFDDDRDSDDEETVLMAEPSVEQGGSNR